jgi:hypothetical protein
MSLNIHRPSEQDAIRNSQRPSSGRDASDIRQNSRKAQWKIHAKRIDKPLGARKIQENMEKSHLSPKSNVCLFIVGDF